MNTLNFTQHNSECPGDSDIVRTIKVMAIMLSVGFGVFGNVLVVFIAVKYTRRTNIHHLIVNMAVSDTMVILLYTLHMVPALIKKYYAWLMIPNISVVRNLCRTVRVLDVTSKSVNLVTLVIISIERYRATRVTALRLRPYTMRQKVAAVTGTWGLSFMLSCSGFFFNPAIYPLNGIYVCYYVTTTLPYKIGLILASGIFILSFTLILVLGILTSLRLKMSSVIHANLTDVQRQVRAKRIANAVSMVVCSLLVYGCCYFLTFFWLVYAFQTSVKDFSSEPFGLSCKGINRLFFMTDFLMTLNSCLSPYIYIIFLPEFRETTKRLLFSKQTAEQAALEHGTADVEDQGNNYHSQNFAL